MGGLRALMRSKQATDGLDAGTAGRHWSPTNACLQVTETHLLEGLSQISHILDGCVCCCFQGGSQPPQCAPAAPAAAAHASGSRRLCWRALGNWLGRNRLLNFIDARCWWCGGCRRCSGLGGCRRRCCRLGGRCCCCRRASRSGGWRRFLSCSRCRSTAATGQAACRRHPLRRHCCRAGRQAAC